jgi:uncharacterized protein HemX
MSDFDYASFISGGAGLAGSYYGMVNQDLGLQAPPALQRSATGEPVYNLGSSFNQAYLSKPQGASGEEIVSGLAQGAQAGAAFGPVGAGVGAAVGLATSIFGGARRKHNQQREKDNALAKVSAGQNTYNKAANAYQETQLALNDYQRRSEMTNHLYNLFRSNG